MSNDNPAPTSLDLQGLARTRPTTVDQPPRRSASLGTWARRLFPLLIVALFVSLLTWALRDHWLPTVDVTVIPVVASTSQDQPRSAGTPLFQAAGWIEPRPSAVKATALTGGIVAEVFVVAGQDVTAGQPVAQLIDTDARLELRRAEAVRDLRQAELDQARATADAAAQRLKYPVHLQAEVAQGEAALARSEIEAAKLPFLLQAARSQVDFAEKLWQNRAAAQASLAGRLVDEARAQRDAAVADWEELQQRQQHLTVEQTALRDHLAAVQQKLALQVGEHQAVAEATAQVAAARARLLEAEVAVEHAALVLERMIVRAPLSGRILERLAEPGSSLMGLDSRGGHQSSAVATLYDPATLQVRADVRLEDYAQVVPDQEVKIETASCPAPLRGQVLLSTSTANIQKNTVEVKVAILDPPAVLRPEMLVTATFLAPNTTSNPTPNATAVRRVLIPQELVFNDQGQPHVWVLTHDQRAEPRAIQVSQSSNQGLIEVTAGLQLADKLIVDGRENLTPSTRVNPRPQQNTSLP